MDGQLKQQKAEEEGQGPRLPVCRGPRSCVCFEGRNTKREELVNQGMEPMPPFWYGELT